MLLASPKIAIQFGYLADHKLNEAREMLIYRRLSIKEVADQLGYSSVQHFTKAFKKNSA